MDINGMEAEHARMKRTRQKLDRLMPYHEWCRTVNPTETAKEMYEFVRLTLERELELSGGLEGKADPARGPSRTFR